MAKKFEQLLETMKCPECDSKLRLYQCFPKDPKRRYKWLSCKQCNFEITERIVKED